MLSSTIPLHPSSAPNSDLRDESAPPASAARTCSAGAARLSVDFSRCQLLLRGSSDESISIVMLGWSPRAKRVGAPLFPAYRCRLPESFLGIKPFLFVVAHGPAPRLVTQSALSAGDHRAGGCIPG